jgi:hypothetical protein
VASPNRSRDQMHLEAADSGGAVVHLPRRVHPAG